MKAPFFLVIIVCFLLMSCSSTKNLNPTKAKNLTDSLSRISDSVKIGNITIHNLFKSQILASRDSVHFDSLLIIKKVYQPHKQLWDSCYGTIFGEENASKFNTPGGMAKWNKTLYATNKKAFDQKARELLRMNLDSTLRVNLKKFNQMAGYNPIAIISILFTPIQGIGFGGCNAQQFALELNFGNKELAYVINKGIPHELNHLVYEPFIQKDPDGATALAQTIDEGFACYFAWVFFDRQIPKYQTVENMTESDWKWYLNHEQEIFDKVKVYFSDKSGNNPLLRNNKFKLFPDAPKTLLYWLGFRIVEAYVESHGKDSWKDIYTMPIKQVLEKSGYSGKINRN
jgi:hypothetical protein